MTAFRQSISCQEWTRILLAGAGTLGVILLANQTEEIGERIPFVFLALSAGSATMAALVFVPSAPNPAVPAPQTTARRPLWAHKLRLTFIGLLPLAVVPLLEIRRSGYDPALWLIDGALVITLCSVPYFTLLARSVVGGVALSVAAPWLLWVPVSTAFFSIIRRSQQEGIGTTADPIGLHAFFAPEFRHLFYILCAMILGVYCPIMMVLSRRRFLRTSQDAEPGAAPDRRGTTAFPDV